MIHLTLSSAYMAPVLVNHGPALFHSVCSLVIGIARRIAHIISISDV